MTAEGGLFTKKKYLPIEYIDYVISINSDSAINAEEREKTNTISDMVYTSMRYCALYCLLWLRLSS